MSKKKVLEQLIEENNGYLITSMAAKCDVSRTYLSQYVKEKKMEKVARGIYITDDVWPDELYIMQVRNAAVIFSGETALYLHGLIDREYTDICITVPSGYNATHLKADNVRVKYVHRDIYEMGVCNVTSNSGNIVKVYDKERCICELIMERNNVEVQNFQTAMKDYMFGKDKKISRLVEYAEKFGIRDEVMKYVEVLI
ncbi:MAG: type IV toxin-antitoxin system AbiEi family antitoxin domain-containing protein [Lachnospiraceae bacterium]|nr:type IV toxin-antitoxin system AbiEi family antitoxin domain-containing protein [Lachnospiraceae bacterium]